MRYKTLDATPGHRMLAVVFESEEEVSAGLLRAARELNLSAAHLSAIGALQDAVLGYWDPAARDYVRIRISEQVEVLSLLGNLATAPDGGLKLHAHLVLGKRDGTAHGGHLLEAHVRPTLEVVLTESPERLRRRPDPATQLALLEP